MQVKSLLLIVVLIGVASPALSADVKKQLQGIKKEIKEKKQLIDKTAQVETRVSGELEEISRSLKEKEKALSALTRDLDAAESGLEKTQHEIEVVQKDAEARKLLIQKRLSAVYKSGDVGNFRFYFSSESFPLMQESLRYMKALLENDRKLILEYNERIDTLKTLKKSLEGVARRKENIKSVIEVKKHEIENEKSKKASYLLHVREDKKSYLASLHELEDNSRRLQSIVERLEAASRKSYTAKVRKQSVKPKSRGAAPVVPPITTSTGFASQKGRLSLPAQGHIVGSFGRHKHPEFNSFTVSNGVTISSPSGSDVHSIYDGTVVFADYFKGYGNMVIIDHGDGFFSLYAHNNRIMKRSGATVRKNETIASVGDVDSSKGPVLYFEIRYQGKPIDPTPWIH
jgi:septal ring factor EnvC (AmiA/AmiB activator)